MLFSSSIFLFLFLPATLIGYQLIYRFGRNAILSWLSIVSLFFYAYWSPVYLILLAASILFNFLISLSITAHAGNDKRQSTLLVSAIIVNLLLLMYFKYLFPLLNFFHDHGSLPHGFRNLVLPLGISFFTFTEIAFLIDLKQGIAHPQSLLSYTLFVTFFPHLIAGPIIHPREMMPQFAVDMLKTGLKREDLAVGLTWFVMGLGKKVLLADPLSTIVNPYFSHPETFGLAGTWIGVLGYAMQLYFDFSGYSDMAVGIARMFSIEFPVNFDSPFKSVSIVDFWTRWHMTLSRYLNEYLYNPISQFIRNHRERLGKRNSRKVMATPRGFLDLVAFPTLSTMLIAGLWHGAGLQYIIYGLLHGVYISVYHVNRVFIPRESAFHKLFPKPVSILVTFLSVVFALVFFRASSVHSALYICSSMLAMHGRGPGFTGNLSFHGVAGPVHYLQHAPVATMMLVCCFAICWFLPNTQQLLNQLPREESNERLSGLEAKWIWEPTLAWGVSIALLLGLSIMMLDANSTFLYFQF